MQIVPSCNAVHWTSLHNNVASVGEHKWKNKNVCCFLIYINLSRVPFLCYCGCNMTAHCWPRGEGMSSAWIIVVVCHNPVCQYNCTVRSSDVDVILCIVCTVSMHFDTFLLLRTTFQVLVFCCLRCTKYVDQTWPSSRSNPLFGVHQNLFVASVREVAFR
jgi:hypothetical protein